MTTYFGPHAYIGLIISVFLGIFAIAFLAGIVGYVLNGFAFMALYRKVGVEPWAAWVPFFTQYRLLELGGQPGWMIVLVLIPSVGSTIAAIFECLGVYRINLAFGKTGSWVVLFIFLPFVWAWLLASDTETYDLQRLYARGYPPPLAGYGSPRGPYVPPQQAA